MSEKLKVDIYNILDMFNKEINYLGLNNDGKTTDERDDIITRQTFNNWLREYNKYNDRIIESIKKDQYNNEWYTSDIKKLIKTDVIQHRLKLAAKRKTITIHTWPSETVRYSKRRYEECIRKRAGIEHDIEQNKEYLLDTIIENSFTLTCKDERINSSDYFNREKIIEDFIDMEKVTDVATKKAIGLYDEYENGVPVLEGVPETDFFLK